MAAALDPAVVAALLSLVGVCAAALRCGRTPEAEDHARPWLSRGWLRTLTPDEQQAARARATEVARLTVGEAVWTAFVRDGYAELPSAAEPGTCYRLRPARRVEIRAGDPFTRGLRFRTCTRVYLCVYPTYELPAVEFWAQLYLRLRDDEQRVRATGHIQARDGPIPNVF